MTDKKLTDAEIIKALKCHFNEELDEEPFRCVDCPLYDDTSPSCTEILKFYALDLINRQKAEIERLKGSVIINNIMESQRIKREAKTKAYKEFAERIKEEIENAYNNNSNVLHEHMSKHAEYPDYEFIAIVRGKMTALQGLDDFIDNLLKEMVGEGE